MLLCVNLSQLRQTVFQFAQKELAPKAAEIDRENTFREMRVSTNCVLVLWKSMLQIMHVSEAYKADVMETFHILIAVLCSKKSSKYGSKYVVQNNEI